MTTTPAIPRPRPPVEPRRASLPRAVSVLAVTARPGQESADLGGLLYAFRRSGARLSLLCLTRGEAAGRNSGPARLEAIRPWEVQLAATVLGVSAVAVASYRDGALPEYPAAELAERIGRAIRERAADLVVVVAPEAGDRADTAVARAALAAAAAAGVPVIGSTGPDARGAWTLDLGGDAEAARACQRSAMAAHDSQSDALPALIRRLDRLGPVEAVRWLQLPEQVATPRARELLVTA
jgi:N-acetylglucosamine malate deacetylase 2